MPCLVFVHGESYEWSSGNAYDGTTLAANGNIVVVTINFRLGVLGKFLVLHNVSFERSYLLICVRQTTRRQKFPCNGCQRLDGVTEAGAESLSKLPAHHEGGSGGASARVSRKI